MFQSWKDGVESRKKMYWGRAITKIVCISQAKQGGASEMLIGQVSWGSEISNYSWQGIGDLIISQILKLPDWVSSQLATIFFLWTTFWFAAFSVAGFLFIPFHYPHLYFWYHCEWIFLHSHCIMQFLHLLGLCWTCIYITMWLVITLFFRGALWFFLWWRYCFNSTLLLLSVLEKNL